MIENEYHGKDLDLQFCRAIDTTMVYGDVHRSFSLWNRSYVIGGTFEEILVLNELMKFIETDDVANKI